MLQITSWYEQMVNDPKFEMFMVVDSNNNSLGVAGLTYIDFINKHADLHFYVGKDEQWIDNDCTEALIPLLLEYSTF